MKSKEEIKPCPFCGSTNIMFGNAWDVYHDGWYIYCGCCSCEITRSFGSKEKAIQAWNTRIKVE